MIYTTNGIVLHQLRYSDSSVIAKVYTERDGLCSYLVRGIGKKKSGRKSAVLQPLSLVEITARHKTGQLQTAREIRLWKPYQQVQTDVVKCTIALFMAEVLYRSLREESPNPELFEFLTKAFELLDLESEVTNFPLWFLLRYSQFLGFEPLREPRGEVRFFDLREGEFLAHHPSHPDYEENPVASAIFAILGTNFVGLKGISISGSTRQMVLDTLLRYFRMHLEGMKEIKAHQVLQTVLHD